MVVVATPAPKAVAVIAVLQWVARIECAVAVVAAAVAAAATGSFVGAGVVAFVKSTAAAT